MEQGVSGAGGDRPRFDELQQPLAAQARRNHFPSNVNPGNGIRLATGFATGVAEMGTLGGEGRYAAPARWSTMRVVSVRTLRGTILAGGRTR